MWFGCTVLLDSKEAELRSSNQEASPSAGKNSEVVCSSIMFVHGNASLQLFLVVWIFLRSFSVICYGRWILSEGHINYFKDWLYEYLMPSIEFCWLWFFPWIKLSWHSCSVWDKPVWLNWLWQFLCEGLFSFNLKRFCYSYVWSHSLCEGKSSFCMGLISRKVQIITYVFDWLYLTQCLTSFSCIDHLLFFYVQFLILFIWHRWGSLNQPIC